MNDKELTKAAALGVGYSLYPEWDYAEKGIFLGRGCDGDLQYLWNPLDDDGDALRLLASLPSLWWLKLKFGSPTVEMNIAWGTGGEKTDKIGRAFAGQGADRAAAIRRAIVLAAAQLPPNAELCGGRSESERAPGSAAG